MWDKIELSNWAKTPCITGRPATENDISNGIAVFCIPNGSNPYPVNLPLFAVQIDKETKERTPCIAIQIEQADNGVFIGVRYLTGGNGVGTADEFELYEEPTEEFVL